VIEISLIKPVLNLSSSTFDATKNFVVNFVVNSGDQVVANEILIQKSSDNSQVWLNKTPVPTFSLSQIIPANTLQNSSSDSYKICIRTYNEAGDYSQYSDWILINCYSDPVIDISNIVNNGIVNNQNFTPQATYLQAQSDPLQFYKYILYDSSNMEISNSGTLYDGLLSYQFIGLENNKSYSIELQCTTQHNVTISVTKIFQVNFIQPDFTNFVQLINNPTQATIDVEIVAIRTLGYISAGSVGIENNDLANTLAGTLSFDSSHGLQLKKSDWTVQMWVKNLIDSKIILTLYGQNNVTFKIVYEFGQFHLYKYIGDVYFAHYRSNTINPTVDNVVYLFIQSIDDRINLKCEIIS
jgi:hypothetical protein